MHYTCQNCPILIQPFFLYCSLVSDVEGGELKDPTGRLFCTLGIYSYYILLLYKPISYNTNYLICVFIFTIKATMYSVTTVKMYDNDTQQSSTMRESKILMNH